MNGLNEYIKLIDENLSLNVKDIELNNKSVTYGVIGLRKELTKKIVEDVFDIKKLLLDKYLIDDGDKIYINEKYLYISNEILINFI